jgi:hypothetical protein
MAPWWLQSSARSVKWLQPYRRLMKSALYIRYFLALSRKPAWHFLHRKVPS